MCSRALGDVLAEIRDGGKPSYTEAVNKTELVIERPGEEDKVRFICGWDPLDIK